MLLMFTSMLKKWAVNNAPHDHVNAEEWAVNNAPHVHVNAEKMDSKYCSSCSHQC